VIYGGSQYRRPAGITAGDSIVVPFPALLPFFFFQIHSTGVSALRLHYELAPVNLYHAGNGLHSLYRADGHVIIPD
jgi:hypothetical protein